jgi:DNA replication protein DnaC
MKRPSTSREAGETARFFDKVELKEARIGRFKPLCDFDWTWPKCCDRATVEPLMALDFLKEAANVILVGPNGVGKSRLAQNIAHQALIEGHTALFTSAGQLLGDLCERDSDSALPRRPRHYARPELVVIDEVGYLSYSNRHADLMFELFSRRYQSRLFLHLFGLQISEGALDAMLQRTKPWFDNEVAAILARLRRSRIVGSDETSVRIDGRTHWNWVFQNDQVVIHVIRNSLAASVVTEAMAGHRPSIWVSDLYGAQQGYAGLWQVCQRCRDGSTCITRIHVRLGIGRGGVSQGLQDARLEMLECPEASAELRVHGQRATLRNSPGRWRVKKSKPSLSPGPRGKSWRRNCGCIRSRTPGL